MSKQPVEIEQLSFETAFQELEEIVTLLESDQPLEEALRLYERGQGLAKHCASLLDQAELRVQQIAGDALTNFLPD